MPGSGTGSFHKAHIHTQNRGGREQDVSCQESLLSQSIHLSPECYQERCVDPVDLLACHRVEMQQGGNTQNASPRDTQESEKLGCIPGSVELSHGEGACAACPAPGWGGCRLAVCYMLTCGLYRTCQRCRYAPCLPASESSTDPPETGPSETLKPICLEPKSNKLLQFDSIRYPDIRIGGKEVILPDTRAPKSAPALQSEGEKGNVQQPFSSMESISLLEDELDDWSDGSGDVDSLITRKLLELYTLHQIEQLAICTSDSVFLSKTNEISRLICDVGQEHNLREEEAECRLVHSIIRISTRKSKKKGKGGGGAWGSRVEGTPRDSGNDTMTDTLNSNYIDHVQISEQTSSDKRARQMWVSSGRAHSSSSPTACSPCHQDSDSSGAPLLHTQIRT